MGGTLSSMGELDASRHHFEAALMAYDERHPQRSALGSDLGVFAHAWYAHTLLLLGDERAAVSHVEEAVALAQRLDHVYSQTIALAYAAMLHQMRRDADHVLECAEAVVALCERYGFAYYGDWAHVLIGWARGLERPAEGVEMIESALDRLDANRAHARRPYYLSLLADVYRPREPGACGFHSGDGHHDRARVRRRVVAARAVPPEERVRSAAGARRDSSPRARSGPRAKEPGPGRPDSRVFAYVAQPSGLPARQKAAL